ncbi:hypothetical protein ADM98_16130 [Exiguobacterium sp. BMC-KP]|nr:hypothetical protein ADM98_16130 [Exiguobacterium sp. BMC-KP]
MLEKKVNLFLKMPIFISIRPKKERIIRTFALLFLLIFFIRHTLATNLFNINDNTNDDTHDRMHLLTSFLFNRLCML